MTDEKFKCPKKTPGCVKHVPVPPHTCGKNCQNDLLHKICWSKADIQLLENILKNYD